MSVAPVSQNEHSSEMENLLSLIEWLRDEANTRLVANIGVVAPIFGLVISALFALVTYTRRARRKDRDEILQFLSDWNHSDRDKIREPAIMALRRYNNDELSFDQIAADDAINGPVRDFLNELELLGLFIMKSGNRRRRLRYARRLLGDLPLRNWKRAKKFVGELRVNFDDPTALVEFENLAKQWPTRTS